MKIYSVKDRLKGYGPLFLEPNDSVALRLFTKAVNDTSSDIADIFEDTELYCLGDFDYDTGVISSDIRFISRGSDVKKVSVDEV